MKREEAIQNIKKLLGFSDTLDESIFTLFPELKESKDNEDERIIEQIKFAVMQMPSDREDTKKECLAWLEKQKEIKFSVPGLYCYDARKMRQIIALLSASKEKCMASFAKEIDECIAYLIEKQKEQKPSINIDQLKSLMLQYLQEAANEKIDSDIEAATDKWARKIFGYDFEQKPVEDWREKRKKECPFRIADGCKQYGGVISECTGACSWVVDYPKLKEIQDKRERKSATWRGNDGMKPAKWSEEDEEMRKTIIWVLESYISKDTCESNPSLTASYPTYYKEIDWLKSLSSQLHWKPSEEQMQALWEIYQGGEAQAPIASLYDDLKKLMEE